MKATWYKTNAAECKDVCENANRYRWSGWPPDYQNYRCRWCWHNIKYISTGAGVSTTNIGNSTSGTTNNITGSAAAGSNSNTVTATTGNNAISATAGSNTISANANNQSNTLSATGTNGANNMTANSTTGTNNIEAMTNKIGVATANSINIIGNAGTSTNTINSANGAPIRVTGVADGTTDYDAVNFRQLQKANMGIAAVSALAAIPGTIPGKIFAIGAGYGYFENESAVAIGVKALLGSRISVTVGGGMSVGRGASSSSTITANG